MNFYFIEMSLNFDRWEFVDWFVAKSKLYKIYYIKDFKIKSISKIFAYKARDR